MKKFVKPEFNILKNSNDNKIGSFLIEPVERGFAITLGNAIRRTLLSSTPGPAIFGVKIKGANHEFSSLNGVRENVAKIILNIKSIILKVESKLFSIDEVFEMELSSESNNSNILKAKDIKLPNGIEVLNKDLVIVNLEKNAKFNATLYAKVSCGYKTFNDNKDECKEISMDVISIDSNFSPIEKVNFFHDDTKVGNINELEKLVLDIETNGSITSIEAISIASKILIDHFSLFTKLDFPAKDKEIFLTTESEKKDNSNQRIEELNFSQRTKNCLKNSKIYTLKDITKFTAEEIKHIKNLGKKSFDEIKDKLKENELAFKI